MHKVKNKKDIKYGLVFAYFEGKYKSRFKSSKFICFQKIK